jgi:photosystem II stability/assembly factor-like uncharacterized protein
MTDSQLDLSPLVEVTLEPTPEVRERLAARLQTLIESEQAGHIEPRGKWQRASWTHRALVVAVAAAIVVVFFVPLPHVSLFKSLVSRAKLTPTSTPMLTSARVTPTEVTGAGGYLWMLGTYPCSTGTCSVVMRSSDGGKSFVRIGTLPAANYRIEFANREDGYAFGSGGPDDQSRLYWTGDGGKTWRLALARFRYSPPQVVVITDGRAYVLVAENCSAKGLCKSVQLASSPVTSHTWTARPLPLTVSEAENQFGWAALGSNVWLILTSVSNARLLVSHDAGRTFSKLTPGGYLGALGCSLTATSPTTLWGFCATGNGGYAIRSTDGGRSFVSLRTPGGMSNNILIYPVSDSEAMFYPLAGDMWLTQDGGRHFTSLLRIPYSSEYTCEVALASARTWLVLASSGYGRNTSYLMWRTTNAGRSWQTEHAPRVPTTSSSVKPTGVVTGVVQACEGVQVPAGEILHVKVSLYSGSKRVASETVVSGTKYRFSVSPGTYRLTGWWGSKGVRVRAGRIATANFMNYCV